MTASASMTFAAAIRSTLEHALESDPAVVVLGDSVGRAGGHGGTTAGLQARFGTRVLDLPIADRGTVGYALGVALAGGRPVVELADTRRLFAVLEVLAQAATIATQREFSVPLVVRVPYGTDAPGLDQAVGPWLARIDGLQVVVPSTPAAAAGLLRHALAANHPTVILEPRAALDQRGQVSDEATTPSLRVVRPGSHLTVATWGTAVASAVEAAARLESEGIDIEVVDLVRLAPLDTAVLGQHVRATGRLLVVHPDDPAMADHVRNAVTRAAFLYLESPLADAPPDAARITRAARDAVRY